ncbi:MAG: right-handed parallel beta-helix repeat-containing protein [Ignavibacteriales bacterium]|nr:right-handed parallel beta-helix repeat-containing protein [Ignavibacteriales bacterium]
MKLILFLILSCIAFGQEVRFKVDADTTEIRNKGLTTPAEIVAGRKSLDSLFLNEARFKDNITADSTLKLKDGIFDENTGTGWDSIRTSSLFDYYEIYFPATLAGDTLHYYPHNPAHDSIFIYENGMGYATGINIPLADSTTYKIAKIPRYPPTAKTYFVSSSGNDNNTGLSPDLAWQTHDKVNTMFDSDTNATNYITDPSFELGTGRALWEITLNGVSSGTTISAIGDSAMLMTTTNNRGMFTYHADTDSGHTYRMTFYSKFIDHDVVDSAFYFKVYDNATGGALSTIRALDALDISGTAYLKRTTKNFTAIGNVTDLVFTVGIAGEDCTQDSAFVDYIKLYDTALPSSLFLAGDAILFKRGDVFTVKSSADTNVTLSNLADGGSFLYNDNAFGDAGLPLVMGAYGSGERPRFWIEKKLNGGIVSEDKDNIYVSNLDVAGARRIGIKLYNGGVRLTTGVGGNRIIGNYVHDVGWWYSGQAVDDSVDFADTAEKGVVIGGTYGTIAKNVIDSVANDALNYTGNYGRVVGNYVDNVAMNDSVGDCYEGSGATNLYLAYNTFWKNKTGKGYITDPGGAGSIIEYNFMGSHTTSESDWGVLVQASGIRINNNYFSGIDTSQVGGGGYAINLTAVSDPDSCTIYNNIFVDCYGGIKLENKGSKIYNNTFANINYTGIYVVNGAKAEIVNNIITMSGDRSPQYTVYLQNVATDTLTMSNNDYYPDNLFYSDGAYLSFNSWALIQTDNNSFVADPLLEYGFRLRYNSPAKDAGTTGLTLTDYFDNGVKTSSANLITNGTFDDSTGWVLGDVTHTISGGVLNIGNLEDGSIRQAYPFVNGKKYLVSLDVVSTGNFPYFFFTFYDIDGWVSNYTDFTRKIYATVGHQEFVVTNTANNILGFIFINDEFITASIDNLTIQELKRDIGAVEGM